MPHIGPTEMAIVLVIALLVLGPKRLPAAARSLGDGIREFKDSITRRGPAATGDLPMTAAPAPDRVADHAPL